MAFSNDLELLLKPPASEQVLLALESGEEVERDCRFLKQSTVFNACQVEGLPPHFYALAEPPKEKLQRIEHPDRFFKFDQELGLDK